MGPVKTLVRTFSLDKCRARHDIWKGKRVEYDLRIFDNWPTRPLLGARNVRRQRMQPSFYIIDFPAHSDITAVKIDYPAKVIRGDKVHSCENLENSKSRSGMWHYFARFWQNIMFGCLRKPPCNECTQLIRLWNRWTQCCIEIWPSEERLEYHHSIVFDEKKRIIKVPLIFPDDEAKLVQS